MSTMTLCPAHIHTLWTTPGDSLGTSLWTGRGQPRAAGSVDDDARVTHRRDGSSHRAGPGTTRSVHRVHSPYDDYGFYLLKREKPIIRVGRNSSGWLPGVGAQRSAGRHKVP